MTAEIVAAAVPLSKAAQKLARQWPFLLETIFTGGDDYELLCAVSPPEAAAFEASAIAAGIVVHKIGAASPGAAPPVFKEKGGRNLVFAQPSFRHF